MRSCSTQFYVLEHYLRLKTNRPENWLSSLQTLTRSPRLSMELERSYESGEFSGRLAFLETGSVNVCGFYLRSATSIFGANAGSDAIIMPLQGTVTFEVDGEHFVSAPGAPFVLAGGVDFYARLSPRVHLFIVQPDSSGCSGISPNLKNGDPELVTLLESYLVETPFFRDHSHALERTTRFGDTLNAFMAGCRENEKNRKAPALISEERRLCRALELINSQLNTDVDLGEIAKNAGMSLRNFYYLMKKYTGLTPYAYCLSRRLIKARESLICGYRADPVVANHALQWGFNHAGRFSSYYRDHFGEYPSETLERLETLQRRAENVWLVDSGPLTQSSNWYTSSDAVPA